MAPVGGTRQLTQKLQVTTGLKPSNAGPNSPGQAGAEVTRSRFEGKVTAQEAPRLARDLKKDGFDRFDSKGQKPAKEKLELFLSQSAPLPPSQVTLSGGVEIRASGVQQSAVEETLRLTRELTSARPDIAERLRAENHMVVVVPEGSKLTDVAEFQSLRGQQTFDGRPWDDVRGVANVSLPGGRSATAIPEENLSELSTDAYSGNFSVGIHEFAHAIHRYGVTDEERQAISDAYQAQKARGGAFTDDYASQNDVEYFAQLTNAYFGRNEGQGHNGAAWVEANDPEAFALLQQIYGPPRQL